MKNNAKKINESAVRKAVSSGMKKALNELFDTPEGKWMAGRLDSRQFDRAEGTTGKSPVSGQYPKIRKTTVDVNDYMKKNHPESMHKDVPDVVDSDPYREGERLEWRGWRPDDDMPDEHYYTDRIAGKNYEKTKAYGKAMADVIRDRIRKKNGSKKIDEDIVRRAVSKSIMEALGEDDADALRKKMGNAKSEIYAVLEGYYYSSMTPEEEDEHMYRNCKEYVEAYEALKRFPR